MNQLVSALSGANGAVAQTNSYYSNAENQAAGLGKGSLASTYVGEQNAALQPQFKAQDQQLAGKEAAMGITNSGAAKADFGNLAADQSATIASADAPLYQQSLGVAGNILGAQPGADQAAYQAAIQNFYQALNDAATFFGPKPPTAGQQQPDYVDNGIPGFSDPQQYQVPYDPNAPYQPGGNIPIQQVPGVSGTWAPPAQGNPYAGVGPQP